MESEAGRLPWRPLPEPSPSLEPGGTFQKLPEWQIKRMSFGVTQTGVQMPASPSLVMCPWGTHSLSFGFPIYRMDVTIKLPGEALGAIA